MKTKIFTALVIIASSIISATPANAAIDWGDSRTTKDKLETACRGGGGTFTEYPDGGYSCVTTRPDGTYVQVFCDASGDCFWYTDDNTFERPGLRDLARPIRNNDNVIAPVNPTPTRPARLTLNTNLFQSMAVAK